MGVFDTAGSSHEYYQPAFVFQRGLGTSAKSLAEAASHELGHNLGLAHDGTATAGYYAGQGSWAPIMGVGYSKPVTQFSSGEYTSANNTQDDFAVAASNGASIVTDDHADSADTTSSLSTSAATDGVVSTATDTDWFRFAAAGSTTVTVTPQSMGPNLDAKLEIRDSSGAVVASSDPPVTTVNGSTAGGLGASVTFTAAAGTYYAVVDGTGWGDPAGTGYSGYGSRGRYQVSLATTPAAPVSVSTTSLPRGTVGQPYQVNLAATGGSAPYTWTVASGALPGGVTLSSGGVLSGTPSSAGTATVRFTATDSTGASATSASLTLTVDPAAVEPVSVTTSALPGGVVGRTYSSTLAATGGTSPYAWSVVAGALPAGLTLSANGTISGTPSVAGASSVTVRAQDAVGVSATRVLQLTVAQAPVPLTVTTTALPTAYRDTSYSASLTATGGTAPYTWRLTSGWLPTGLRLTAAGVVAGRPRVAQTRRFTVRCTDGAHSASHTYTIVVR